MPNAIRLSLPHLMLQTIPLHCLHATIRTHPVKQCDARSRKCLSPPTSAFSDSGQSESVYGPGGREICKMVDVPLPWIYSWKLHASGWTKEPLDRGCMPNQQASAPNGVHHPPLRVRQTTLLNHGVRGSSTGKPHCVLLQCDVRDTTVESRARPRTLLRTPYYTVDHGYETLRTNVRLVLPVLWQRATAGLMPERVQLCKEEAAYGFPLLVLDAFRTVAPIPLRSEGRSNQIRRVREARMYSALSTYGRTYMSCAVLYCTVLLTPHCSPRFEERLAAAERCRDGMTFISPGCSDRHNLWSLAPQPTPLLYATDS